jgi:ribosomal protein S27AE
MSGCRDCSRCTEAWIVTLALLPGRILWKLFTGWNVGLVRRHCPQCGHYLRFHQRLADGRFKD